MATIGYARVSTEDQNLALQRDALTAAGCTRLFEDKISGKTTERPGLTACLDRLEPGDTLVVWRLDRLGRNMVHLIETINGLTERGVGFRSLDGLTADASATGKLVTGLLALLAEFERSLISERTKAGLAAARARGRQGGRKPVLTAEQKGQALKLYASQTMTVAEIAVVLGCSKRTIERSVRAC
jgi:DNA invertase Pin-like site-specific DNA recombinase